MVDFPDRIPPSGTPTHHHRKESNTRQYTRLSSRHCHQDVYSTDIADQDHSHTITDIKVIVAMTHTKVIPDLIIDATIGVITVTHHTTDHPHIGVVWHIPETTAYPNHNLHTDQVRTDSINLQPNIAEPSKIPR